MKTASPAPPGRSPASVFRSQIEAAQAAGFSTEALILRLTAADVSRLKHDRELAVSDISFVGGLMRFLGVAVQQDSAAVSEFVRL